MNMQFLNLTSNVPKTVINTQIPPQPNVIPNMFMRSRYIQFRSPQPPSQSPVVAPPEEPAKSKMIWGAPIWYLFHTLAEKVKPDDFQTIRVPLLNNIYIICSNLPCPMCSMHAKEYLNGINFNAIQTKSDLKNMLFEFHNAVNKRKGYPLFSISELEEKYSKAVTLNIIQNFMIHFQDKQRSPKLIADDLQRAHIAIQLKEWFQNNLSYFD
jgi:hypothetical protein